MVGVVAVVGVFRGLGVGAGVRQHPQRGLGERCHERDLDPRPAHAVGAVADGDDRGCVGELLPVQRERLTVRRRHGQRIRHRPKADHARGGRAVGGGGVHQCPDPEQDHGRGEEHEREGGDDCLAEHGGTSAQGVVELGQPQHVAGRIRRGADHEHSERDGMLGGDGLAVPDAGASAPADPPSATQRPPTQAKPSDTPSDAEPNASSCSAGRWELPSPSNSPTDPATTGSSPRSSSTHQCSTGPRPSRPTAPAADSQAAQGPSPSRGSPPDCSRAWSGSLSRLHSDSSTGSLAPPSSPRPR